MTESKPWPVILQEFGWCPTLTEDVLILAKLLLCQAGIATGSPHGRYICGVSFSVHGVLIATTNSRSSKLKMHQLRIENKLDSQCPLKDIECPFFSGKA